MSINSNNNRQRWLALLVLCLGVLMIVLDTTIVNVALLWAAAMFAWFFISALYMQLVLFGRAPVAGQFVADMLPGMILLGLAVLASLAAATTAAQTAASMDAAEVLNAGYQVAFLVGAAFAALAASISYLMLRNAIE